MAGILWLSSYPKSGNTWLRLYLANLFRNPDRPLPINDLPNHVYADNFLLHYEQLSGKKADDLSPEEITALRPKVHDWIANSGRDTVFVKTHNACVLADGQPLITPSATVGAIYVIRNPFDIAVSFTSHYQISVERAVELLCDDDYILPPSPGQIEQVLLSWSGHVTSWTGKRDMRRHVMRYEDMRASPYETFAALSGFLGLPVEPERVEKAIEFSSFQEARGQEEKDGFIEARPDGKAKFFREGRAGIWREAMGEDLAARLIEAHGEVMAEHGYIDAAGKPTV